MRVGFEVTGTEFGLAWRRLRKRWTITVLAVVTLALAMGASTVMFSVSYGLVQHPLPFPRAQRLVWLQSDTASTGRIDPAGLSVPDVLDYRVRTHALEHVAAFEVSSSTMVGRGQPEHVRFAEVSGDFFPALAVPPLLGRSLTRQDEIPSFPRTAVLSYGLWLQKYAANPAVIGRSIDLDHRLLTVVGVMPAGFRYPSRVRIWLPEPMASSPLPYRYWRHVSAIARLRPGVTLVAAQKDMTAIASALAREYPKDDSDVGIKLTSMADHVAGPLAPSVDLMMAGVLLVLALACANVGNLLLGAAITRWPEIALQVSLGARRRRLFGQLLAEGLLLAGLAGAGGWLLAWGAMPLVRHLQGTALPQMADIGLDPAVVAFAVGLTVMMALWFALAPAIELLHPHAGRQLVHSAGNTRRRSRLPGVLVVVEVAITVVLLLGAGLFWQTLRRQRSS
ncbi:MAG: ABC transporter permease, partial [Terriglobales bacterium]